MKKVCCLILSFLLMCAFPLFGCTSNKNKIRLCEVTHSIFYAPMYIAINNGFFQDEGLEIELSNGQGANNVMSALISKSVDIGLMGPEATIYCHVEGQQNYPVIFGQLTKRDGSFLVAKTDQPDFKWSDVAGKRILAGRKGGVPAMTLQYVLNNAGVATDTPLFDTKVEFAAMVSTFQNDATVEYCTMFEPAASNVANAGYGYIVASVGEDSGEVPYTAFSVSKEYMSKNKDKLTKFLKAVDKGYQYLMTADVNEVAKVLRKSFADSTLEEVVNSIKSYKEIEAWCETPVMTEASFNRLQDIMENAGELSTRVDFNKAVDNSIASGIL